MEVREGESTTVALTFVEGTPVRGKMIDPKTGAAGSVFDILNSERHNHQVEISQGILAEEYGALLKEFFQERRNKSS